MISGQDETEVLNNEEELESILVFGINHVISVIEKEDYEENRHHLISDVLKGFFERGNFEDIQKVLDFVNKKRYKKTDKYYLVSNLADLIEYGLSGEGKDRHFDKTFKFIKTLSEPQQKRMLLKAFGFCMESMHCDEAIAIVKILPEPTRSNKLKELRAHVKRLTFSPFHNKMLDKINRALKEH